MEYKRNTESVVQEIMGLVDDVLGCDSAGYQFECKRQIQSKLRELVESEPSMREPLSLERIYEIEAVSNVAHTRTTYTKDCWGDDKKETEEVRVFSFPLFARNIERAHNITNTIKE